MLLLKPQCYREREQNFENISDFTVSCCLIWKMMCITEWTPPTLECPPSLHTTLNKIVFKNTWYVLAQLSSYQLGIMQRTDIPLNYQCLHSLSWDFQRYSVSSSLWCHFQQCPWEVGSVWPERVGQGEMDWYTAWLFLGWALRIPQ